MTSVYVGRVYSHGVHVYLAQGCGVIGCKTRFSGTDSFPVNLGRVI